MNRTNDPGISQWVLTAIIIALGFLLIWKLMQYSAVRAFMPAGMVIAGVNVGGYSEEEVRQVLTNRYLEAPLIIFHGDNREELDPREVAEFQLDFETMLSEAELQRQNINYWDGFSSYLLGLPIEVKPIELRATHNRATLQEVLSLVASNYDEPAQPPQPVPQTLSFLYGERGYKTNIIASLEDVEAALYRPSGREAYLTVEPVDPPRPNINILANLIVNHLEDFTSTGTASIFIIDLQTGDEININGDLPVSGMSILKIPLVLQLYRLLTVPPTTPQQALIEATLLESGNESANELLNIIAGQDNGYIGADMVTQSMQDLGLLNTYMIAPYEAQARPNLRTFTTPANQRPNNTTNPDPLVQTTAEDMASLLSMLYYCADNGGGAIMAAFEGAVTQEECRELLNLLQKNRIGSLVEEGVPPGTPVAHKHGWISDTHGDAAVVYTSKGDYVLVEFLYRPNWLEWEVSSPIMADISRATYNYFNFDTPYFGPQVGQ